MNPATAISQILWTEDQRHPPAAAPPRAESSSSPASSRSSSPVPDYPTLLPPSETLAMTLSRIGTSSQRIVSGTLSELAELSEEDYGGPLHSVVILGKRVHPLELEYAGKFCLGGSNGQWWKVGKEVYGVEPENGR